MNKSYSRFWLSILALLAISVIAGLATGSYVFSNSRDNFIANKASEAEALLSLTSNFVSAYSDIRGAHSDASAPVPAEFRAKATKSFNTSEADDSLTVLMVGVPGRHIVTPATDDAMSSRLGLMSRSAKFTKHTEIIESSSGTILRSMFPSVASKASCVDCHNKIQPDGQRWKRGDLMGALVIDRQVDTALSDISRLGWIIGAITAFSILLVGAPLLSLRHKQLAASNLLVGALDAIDDPFIIYDGNERLVQHNRAFVEKFLKNDSPVNRGIQFEALQRRIYDNGQIRSQPFPEWLKTQRLRREQWLQQIDSSSVTESDGYWYRNTVRTLSSGHLLELHSDISELVRREQELERSRSMLEESDRKSRRLALVAENANDAVIISDIHGRCIWTNNAFTRLTGYSASEILDRKPGDVLQGPDTDPGVVNDISNAIRSGSGIRSEMLNYRKDGSCYWIEIAISPVYSDEGELTNFIAVERDISDQKKYQTELDESRAKAEAASRSKSAFLANMSHEIRTPMNGVLATSELLLDSRLDDDQRQYAQTIYQSGKSLLTIINDVLDFSKIEAGKLELDPAPFDLKSALRDVVSLVCTSAEQKGLQLTLDYSDDLAEHFIGDVGRIRQIVTNLVGNAIKFTLTGSVDICVSGKASQDMTDIVIKVKDTGIGIKPENVDAVFAEFDRGDSAENQKFEGTGLGLAISRSLIELMRGRLSVESVFGEGSTFTATFALPEYTDASGLSERTQDHPDHSTTDSDPAQLPNGVRILIAEDNKTNQFVIKKMLGSAGSVDIRIAENGRDVIHAWKEFDPHIILMDVLMPEMNGMEATTAIRSIEHADGLERCPIIALTANAMRGDREQCISAGMDDYVSKPISKSRLLEALLKWISVRDLAA